VKTVLAFDVYGTLIDTAGVVLKLRDLVGDRAEEFSRTWRAKQLEYSFRRGLMHRYANFGICTSDALDYTCACLKAPLTRQEKEALLNAYSVLPAFGDVSESLVRLSADGFALYAFSNGTANAVETLLETAGIREHFLDVVSVDELETFKPNPAVYQHFLRRSGANAGDAWLVSGNPFDVIGAIAAGLQGAWVRRDPEAIFDPWRVQPTLTVTSLLDLRAQLASHRSGADSER
jgi:2-haloacid dehalogenase